MAHDGLFHGGTAPYGYHLVQSGIFNKKKKELYKLEIDQEQAKIVQQIFNYVSDYGYGKSRITQILNAEKIPSETGITWSVGTVGSILKILYIKAIQHMVNEVINWNCYFSA